MTYRAGRAGLHQHRQKRTRSQIPRRHQSRDTLDLLQNPLFAVRAKPQMGSRPVDYVRQLEVDQARPRRGIGPKLDDVQRDQFVRCVVRRVPPEIHRRARVAVQLCLPDIPVKLVRPDAPAAVERKR